MATTQQTTVVASAAAGDTIDFTQLPLGQCGRWVGEDIALCPHCQRRGMRIERRPNWQIFYLHRARLVNAQEHLLPVDSCILWPRTEYFLTYGDDGVPQECRDPKGRDKQVGRVEEVREGKMQAVNHGEATS